MRRNGVSNFKPPRALKEQDINSLVNKSSSEKVEVKQELLVGGSFSDLVEEEESIDKIKKLKTIITSEISTTILPKILKVDELKPHQQYFRVLFTKRSEKKRKTFDDGFLVISGKNMILYNTERKQISTGKVGKGEAIQEGCTVSVGYMEVEIATCISLEKYLEKQTDVEKSTSVSNTVSTLPASNNNVLQPRSTGKPAFNPTNKDALILYEGNEENGNVSIVVDPSLSCRLRDHQKEGVRFMFDCVMGFRNNFEGGRGCILADDMGLGKTVQCITLIWTLLKQSLSGAHLFRPMIRKCIIVCPASLVLNWCKEFKKFLGLRKLIPVSITESGISAEKIVKEFVLSKIRPVLIISYEMYRKHSDLLNSSREIDLLICDEGHRLKSTKKMENNKTINALNGCQAIKRIILTGTPLQNELDEFYAIISFCNPNCLLPVLVQDSKQFKKYYQIPIEKGRDKNASKDEILLANQKSKELSDLISSFVLRRTSSIQFGVLPPKTESTVFIRFTSSQEILYKKFLASRCSELIENLSDDEKGGGGGVEALKLIQQLKQLCIHPTLVTTEDNEIFSIELENILKNSGKFQFLDVLLNKLFTCKDRVVIVSSFTSNLNLVETLLKFRNFSYLRLDGSTKIKERQNYVDRFNSDSGPFVFLLSSKAGGCGINLIGANRLILLDLDWNPAIDLQAMARIWRTGQKKPCTIYRLLSTGSIEERIFQRQIMKLETAYGIIQQGSSSSSSQATTKFSRDELKKLFTYQEDTRCDTYDLLNKKQQQRWKPYTVETILEDTPLRETVEILGEKVVSWVHCEDPKTSCEEEDEQEFYEDGSDIQEDDGFDEEEAEEDFSVDRYNIYGHDDEEQM